MKKLVSIILVAMMAQLSIAQSQFKYLYQATSAIPQAVLDMEPGKIKDAAIAQLSKNKASFEMTYSKDAFVFNLTSGSVNNDDKCIYIDLKANKRILQIDFLGRSFLIEEDNKQAEWNITDETKTIGDYHCVKAIFGTKPTVEAWFTMDIPVSFGPMGYAGLPGLIVELKRSNKTYSLIGTEKLTETPQLEAPQKGTKISREEFTALREKKLKELGGVKSGGVRVIKM